MKSKAMLKSALSLLISFVLTFSATIVSVVTASAVEGVSLKYVFSGKR